MIPSDAFIPCRCPVCNPPELVEEEEELKAFEAEREFDRKRNEEVLKNI
jgi:hypothetical protein